MAKTKFVCPHCGQINVRGGSFWFSHLDERRHPEMCTVCGRHLKTGGRSLYGYYVAFIRFGGFYLVHFILGGFIVLFIAYLVLGETFTNSPALRYGSGLVGAALGVWRAEYSRRAGTMSRR